MLGSGKFASARIAVPRSSASSSNLWSNLANSGGFRGASSSMASRRSFGGALVSVPAAAQTAASIAVEGNRRVEVETIRSYFKPGPGGRPSKGDPASFRFDRF